MGVISAKVVRRVAVLGVLAGTVVGGGLLPACVDEAELYFEESAVTLAIGESKTVRYRARPSAGTPETTCSGIAETYVHRDTVDVRGVAPGDCTLTLKATGSATIDIDTTKTSVLAIKVVPNDAGVADAADGAIDGAPPDAGPTPICTAQVSLMPTAGRPLYMAFTNVDSVPDQACPIHPSTDFRGDIVFSFYSGSPGYSIDGRGNYEILTAAPAELMNVGATSSANALEDQMITITFRKRIFADEDASAPSPIWTMTFRMKSDPDPAKWQVELFSFSRN